MQLALSSPKAERRLRRLKAALRLERAQALEQRRQEEQPQAVRQLVPRQQRRAGLWLRMWSELRQGLQRSPMQRRHLLQLRQEPL